VGIQLEKNNLWPQGQKKYRLKRPGLQPPLADGWLEERPAENNTLTCREQSGIYPEREHDLVGFFFLIR
jgi:hypothetical protein